MVESNSLGSIAECWCELVRSMFLRGLEGVDGVLRILGYGVAGDFVGVGEFGSSWRRFGGWKLWRKEKEV